MNIAVGLSGGVDSAVAAALLKQQGYNVIGVFMKNWSDDFGLEGDCPWLEDQEMAYKVAQSLNIEFLTYNFELEYREKVIKYFFQEYKKGYTPNPDVLCNSEIKFEVFLEKALKELKVDKIATGHYARILKGENNIYHLMRGSDKNKDQSYFLCKLNQNQLSQILFPIGHLTKKEVRQIANELKLPNAKRKDSQGICFVGKINVRDFLKKELGLKKGVIKDIDTNKEIGHHDGLWFYTIGQRKGIGLGGGPWFVVEKDIQNNILYVAKGEYNKHLFKQEINLSDLNFVNAQYKIQKDFKLKAEVALRYRQEPSSAEISILNTNGDYKAHIIFENPQRAPAPGQFGVAYLKDELIFSGIIC